MSSPPFDATIDLAPRPSVRALAFLFWLHAALLALAALALGPGVPLAGFAAGVAASWIWSRRHPAFGYGPRALARLTWYAGGGWTLREAGGAQFEAELLGNSLVHDALLLLVFRRPDGGRRARALLGDELDEESLRRLRARLRLLRAAR
jgi:toxin CptA